METTRLIEQTKFAVVNMVSGECWIRLAFSLTKEYVGGELLQFSNLDKVSIQGADDLSSSLLNNPVEIGLYRKLDLMFH